MHRSGPYGRGGWRGQGAGKGVKRSSEDLEGEKSDEEPEDEVRLYEAGFKDRYYESKFEVTPKDMAFRELVANEYAVGLCWVLRYDSHILEFSKIICLCCFLPKCPRIFYYFLYIIYILFYNMHTDDYFSIN